MPILMPTPDSGIPLQATAARGSARALATLVTLACALLASASARADQACDIELHSEIAISESVIRITRDGSDAVWNRHQQLLLDYEPVALDRDQRAAVQAWAEQVRATVPQLVAVAVDGAELGIAALAEVAYGLFSSAPPQEVLDAIDGISNGVDERLAERDGRYIIAGGEVTGLDDATAVAGPAVEGAIETGIGDLLIEIGKGLKAGDGTLELDADDLAFSTEALEARVEARMQDRADDFEVRAHALCERLQALQATERALHDSVPQLAPFRIVKSA